MPATLVRTCLLCGLRFSNLPLLELHIREDHPRRERHPAHDESDPASRAAQTRAPEAADAAARPRLERVMWKRTQDRQSPPEDEPWCTSGTGTG